MASPTTDHLESQKELLGLLIREQAARKAGMRVKKKWTDYVDDPIGFVEEGLGETIWSKQREILTAIRDYDRVAVKACHESSKSFSAARVACWWIACHAPGDAMVVTTAPTFNQVRAILWREINRAHRGILPGRTNQTEWWLNNEIVALGRKPEDADSNAFQGLHSLYMLVILDESCGVSEVLHTAAETLVANEGGKILEIGNPDDPNTEFGRNCLPGSGYHVITISAFDSPNFTDEDVPDDLKRRLISRQWVEQRKKKWGETSPLYISKVLGEFPEVSEDSLIPPRFVTDAVNRSLTEQEPFELGVDVARFGRNQSVIYSRKGAVGRLWGTYNNRDTMFLTGKIVNAVQDTGARTIKIDDIGVGGGVTDRCKELARDPTSPMYRVRIIPVNVGAGATERVVEKIGGRVILAKERFRNLKAELSWQVRDLFYEGQIDIDDDEDTQAQIVAIRYDINSRGLIEIEGKDEVEERLKEIGGATGDSGSPDRWDALVLAFCDPGAAAPIVVSSKALQKSRLPRPASSFGQRRIWIPGRRL